jgi:adenylate cyclase class 2
MAYEIELKAHTADPERCRSRLDVIAGAGAKIVKSDTYWFKPELNNDFSRRHGDTEKLDYSVSVPCSLFPSPFFPASGIRVRREEKSGKAETIITWKSKEKCDGIEVNNENEFTVNDAEVFAELLAVLGLEKRIVKRKEGWRWEAGGITAELCEVSGFYQTEENSGEGNAPTKNLGWFLELEILADDENPETVAASRKRLLELLGKAGLSESDIEEKYYSEMLRT